MPDSLRCRCLSLGCPKNRVDTERLLGSLGVPVRVVDDEQDADLVFINTCGFIRPAVEESVRAVAQAVADLEDIRPRPLLVVGGCLVGRYGRDALAPELPEVDLWLDNAELAAWPDKLRAALGLQGPTPDEGRLLSTGPSYAWVKISDGCRNRCSFCTIPSIRGPLRSRSAPDIEAECRTLLTLGVKELVLVAQDLTAWGQDAPPLNGRKPDLRDLLDRLLPLPGLSRLRLLYLYPTGVTTALLRYLREAGDPFVPYFDVPLQHAHPEVLAAMGRPFSRHDPREVAERIRNVFPDAALRTTFIVGFPGETEAHFAALRRLVEEVRFQHLGVFAYQREEGTTAAGLPGQIAAKIKERRRAELMELQTGISAEWLAGFAGERLEVLVDAPHPDWPGLCTGRTWFQAPEVDGLTYVSGPGAEPGALVQADIVETRDYDLVALV